jgi:hypothetical protein
VIRVMIGLCSGLGLGLGSGPASGLGAGSRSWLSCLVVFCLIFCRVLCCVLSSCAFVLLVFVFHGLCPLFRGSLVYWQDREAKIEGETEQEKCYGLP